MTSIGASAFESCKGLTSVTLPTGLKSLGSRAFYACSNLTNVELPAGVSVVESSAFEKCTSLSSVTLPETVTKIGAFAFRYCDGITDLYFLNPECESGFGSSQAPANAVFHGYAGSTALSWANANSLPFDQIVVHEHYGVLQNQADATCTENGYTGDVVCAGCGETLETGTVIPALQHDWNNANAVFNWDGYTCPDATVTCLNDQSHTTDIIASVTSETILEPTETERGTVKYTATVTFEGETYTKVKEEEIPALNKGLCKWCGERHEGFFGRLKGFVHKIAYFFAHLFGKR